MDARSMYQSGKWLKAADLKGKDPITAVIVRVSSANDKDGNPKCVLEFKNSAKKLQLNKTNFSAIEAALGFETDNWVGKKVTLAYDPDVKLRGTVVGGVKLTVGAQ